MKSYRKLHKAERMNMSEEICFVLESLYAITYPQYSKSICAVDAKAAN